MKSKKRRKRKDLRTLSLHANKDEERDFELIQEKTGLNMADTMRLLIQLGLYSLVLNGNEVSSGDKDTENKSNG